MKIFEYRPFLGTFGLGFERFDQNEVVEVANLPKNVEFPYNNIHKQWFLSNFVEICDYRPQKEFDLAILNPDVGDGIRKQGKSNFKTNDLEDCLTFLHNNRPEFAIFTLDIGAIPLLNTAEDYTRDAFDQVSKDMLITELQKIGYDAYLVALDEASYGISTHKSIALYIATPKNFNMKFPQGLFNQYGLGKFNRYRTIADAIGDLGNLGEWVPYKNKPQNVYQRNLRRGLEKTTWHFPMKKLPSKQIETISKIRQGSGAAKTPSVKQKAGYFRPKWNQICPALDFKFYTVSSKRACIHPLLNRTFTARECMRILGLPDNVSFELNISRPEMAKIIVDSISPTIGMATALALRCI